jgi:excisionase family DNA binding protein
MSYRAIKRGELSRPIVNSPQDLIFENSKWFNTKEAATYLSTSPKQIRKWRYQGRLRGFKLLGKSLRFRICDLDLLLKGDPKCR